MLHTLILRAHSRSTHRTGSVISILQMGKLTASCPTVNGIGRASGQLGGSWAPCTLQGLQASDVAGGQSRFCFCRGAWWRAVWLCETSPVSPMKGVSLGQGLMLTCSLQSCVVGMGSHELPLRVTCRTLPAHSTHRAGLGEAQV